MDECRCNRILFIDAKCSDLCSICVGKQGREGYVPDSFFGEGNYIALEICLDCGKIQSTDFPIPAEEVSKWFAK